jgi:hypothetical protein
MTTAQTGQPTCVSEGYCDMETPAMRRTGFRLAAIPLCLAIATIGCDRQPETAAPQMGNQAATSGNSSGATKVEPVVRPAEVNAQRDLASQLHGTWRVAGVATTTSEASLFSKDDPLIMGSEITINASALTWSKKASADFTNDDICQTPKPVPVSDPTIVENDKPIFSKAMEQFGINPSTGGAIHHWDCGSGTNWGPAADGRLVMGWYDGVTVLLVRR